MKRLLAAGGLFLVAAGIAYSAPAPAYAPTRAPEEIPVRVLFVGDLMLDRNVGKSADADGVASLFSTSTRDLFADADARIANLEGAVTTNPSIARVNHNILHFTFDPGVVRQALDLLHISAVSLANNHTFDFGARGYTETQGRVEASGVAVLGHPYNATGSISTVLTVNDKTLCLIGFHSLYDADTAPVVGEITTLRPFCWRVIVFAHWGDEYQVRSNTAQQEAGHEFIDAGADLVVGAHPHVVQEYEVYKHKAIFYSLGNFMFDQNFSWATTHGLAVRADFYEDKTGFTLTPMTIEQQHSSVSTSTVAEFTLP